MGSHGHVIDVFNSHIIMQGLGAMEDIDDGYVKLPSSHYLMNKHTNVL